MSRQKLESLGLKLPLFPTTSVGSFPKPDYLAKARAEFSKKKISEKDLHDHLIL
jgi:5-methyltetrahydropteroyltriglutamate--homocysteine methyltransferase